MSIPALTVLMTAYNAEAYLDSSIRSILTQTFRDFEFLIIDDGSTDGSVAILERWAGRDDRIRLVLNKSNQGQTPCLNQGIAAARAPWIARQDADDLSDPRRLELQMAAISVRPGLGLLGTNGWLMGEHGSFQGLINAPTGGVGIELSSLFYNPFLHSSVCFRRETALAVGSYDTSLRIAQDYDFWIRLMAISSADNLPERLLTYRVHPTSLSNEGRETTRREADSACRRAFRQWKLGLFEQESNINLIGDFRECNPKLDRAAFWDLYRRVAETFLKHEGLTGKEPALRQARALIHWKLAGSLGRSLPALKETAAALVCSPELISRLLAGRILGPQ